MAKPIVIPAQSQTQPHLQAYMSMVMAEEERRCNTIVQSIEDPLKFEFHVKAGHLMTERLDQWCEANGVKYYDFRHNPVNRANLAILDLNHRPDLAVLFKLTFING